MPRFATPCGAMQFEQYGARADAPVLLIHDAGLQLVQWPPSLIDGLVAAGFRAVVFDNRDAGLSFGVEAFPVDLAGIVAAGASAKGVEAPYSLCDMAEDACRLLDHLGQAGAHVVGFSLGGMIAQRLAIHHPERVFSWTSINATSGAFPLPAPGEDLLPVFAEPSRQPDRHRSNGRWHARADSAARTMTPPPWDWAGSQEWRTPGPTARMAPHGNCWPAPRTATEVRCSGDPASRPS